MALSIRGSDQSESEPDRLREKQLRGEATPVATFDRELREVYPHLDGKEKLRFLVDMMERLGVPPPSPISSLASARDLVQAALRKKYAREHGIRSDARVTVGKLGPFIVREITSTGHLVVVGVHRLFDPRSAEKV